MDELKGSQVSHTVVQNEPNLPAQTFVKLPTFMLETKTASTPGVASIICGNAIIEISEDISETFLSKLIEVISHAQ